MTIVMEAYQKPDLDNMSVETRSGEVPTPFSNMANLENQAQQQHMSQHGSIHNPSVHPHHSHAAQPHGSGCYTTIHHHGHAPIFNDNIYNEPLRLHANVVPVPLLKRHPALVQCPACREVSPTKTKHVAGKGTHWMSALFFFTTGIFVFLPYAMDHFKNCEHQCTKCGRTLAVQRFGGSTQAKLL